MQQSFYARYSWLIIAFLGLLFPVVLVGALLAAASNRNDVKEWLPESFQETQEYHAFQAHFSNETFVLASWEGCTLDDARLDKLAEKLVPTAESQGDKPHEAALVQ